MSYNELKITEGEAVKEINKVQHQNCINGLENNWKIKNGKASFSSVCWLFMWAATGQGSKKAKNQAREAFNKIFNINYDILKTFITEEIAREYRYKQVIHIETHQNISKFYRESK